MELIIPEKKKKKKMKGQKESEIIKLKLSTVTKWNILGYTLPCQKFLSKREE